MIGNEMNEKITMETWWTFIIFVVEYSMVYHNIRGKQARQATKCDLVTHVRDIVIIGQNDA